MHHKTNLSSESNRVPPLHFHIYLPNSTPIDLEDLISMVTRVYKFSFWPAGWGSFYYFMEKWTLAQGPEMIELAKQMWFSIKKNASDILSDTSVLCFTNVLYVQLNVEVFLRFIQNWHVQYIHRKDTFQLIHTGSSWDSHIGLILCVISPLLICI